MPALSVANSRIEEVLRSSLIEEEQKDNLADLLISQSRAVLMKKIDFLEASNQTCEHHQKVKNKYVLSKMNEQLEKKPVVVLNGEYKKSLDGVGLPEPKVVLYNEKKLQLLWRTPLPRIGTGLNNLGNTCFCNATLQCLTFTPPLFYFSMNREHSKTCSIHGFCMLCVLEDHIRNTTSRAGMTHNPWSVVKNFKAISKHFVLGRQEDAHEFLRYVIDNMAKSLLWGKPKLDSISKSTTAIHHIFGGFLRSQVRCKNCEYKSNTYDPFMDIALDIKEANNIKYALDLFTKGEALFGDNAYLCEKCKRKVGATKRFSIHKAPNVLTLQLKRFDAIRLNKINRDIAFPEVLNLRPYMSFKQGEAVLYNLYGVLVHQGFSTNSGHYFSFVKSPMGQWLKVDDSRVHRVSLDLVLKQSAYILFYNRKESGLNRALPQAKVATQSHILQARHTNGPMGNPLIDSLPTSIKKATPSATVTRLAPKPLLVHTKGQSQTPTPNPNINYPHQAPNFTKIASLAGRDKISFGIKSRAELDTEKKASRTGEKLVIKIKDGKVVSNTASPEKSKPNGSILTPQSIPKKPPQLVPYTQEGSSSDEEQCSNVLDSSIKLAANQHTKVAESRDKSVSKRGAEVQNLTNNSQAEINNVKKKRLSNNDSNNSFVPVLDVKLKATTEVPGAYAPLDKEKITNFKSPPSKTHHLDRNHLTLKISDEPMKVNSTSKWNVFENGQKSPSQASSSSSLNSTNGDWKIDSKGDDNHAAITDDANTKAGMVINGWTVYVNGDEEEKQEKATPSKNGDVNHSPLKNSWNINKSPISQHSNYRRPTSVVKNSFKSKVFQENIQNSSSYRHGQLANEANLNHPHESIPRTSDNNSNASSPTAAKTQSEHPRDVNDQGKKVQEKNHSDPVNINSLQDGWVSMRSITVPSWEGGRSSIDQEIIREKRKEKKRKWDDDYEDQLNAGKIKKVRNHMKEDRFGKTNLFQEVFDYNHGQTTPQSKFAQNHDRNSTFQASEPVYSHNGGTFGNNRFNGGKFGNNQYNRYPPQQRGNYHHNNARNQNFNNTQTHFNGNRNHTNNTFHNNKGGNWQYNNNKQNFGNQFNRNGYNNRGGGFRGRGRPGYNHFHQRQNYRR